MMIGYNYPIGKQDWYKDARVASVPPGYVFGIVWTILYTLMGVTFYRILSTETDSALKNIGLVFFGIQMLFNWSFTPLFVNKQLFYSTYSIVFTLLFTLLSLVSFAKIDIYAGLLLVPYVVWLLQALYFNNRIAENVVN